MAHKRRRVGTSVKATMVRDVGAVRGFLAKSRPAAAVPMREAVQGADVARNLSSRHVALSA